MGYRFRLHRRDLPGNPDIVFPKINKVVFVHGCFWHGQNCTRGARSCKQIATIGSKKVAGKQRDRKNLKKLSADGWTSLVVGRCHWCK